MKVLAASGASEEVGMASAQDHSQFEPLGCLSTGAWAKPSLSATCDCCGSNSRPAATVASTHIAHLPVENSARFSLKPFELAPGGP